MRKILLPRIVCIVAGLACLSSSFAEETKFRSIAVGATPESVIPGFGGKLYVTLMGQKRAKGDGDGQVVMVDGEKVSVVTDGLDDPKGIVFIDGVLMTADFDKVWAIDANGSKRLVAGPEAFPTPPLFLNDVAIEQDGAAILVTDMGDLGAMNAPAGTGMWPLDSAEAKNLKPLGRVYRVSREGKVTTVLDHAAEIPNPNGIDILDDGSILIGEFFRGTLMQWKAGQWKQLSNDHRTADGIAHDKAGNIYLTEVRTGRVWHIKAATGEKHLLATLQSAADLYLDEKNNQLIVPDSKAGLLVFIPLSATK